MPSAASNPFVNPPRLPSPSRPRVHNRQLSRSPIRQNPRDCDSLLRDLSPTSTLRAFVTVPHEASKSDTLTTSLQTFSASERALGAKAAQACLDLRTWTLEMESWEWPGTFDFPEPARKSSHAAINSNGDRATYGDDGEELSGSLPVKVVDAYESRANDIAQRLDEMDVEELKEFVLSSHYRVDSRPTSRDNRLSLGSTSSASTSMKPLDDYTALVTATILQALPFLTRLSELLDLWTIRLIVLRDAPRYLQNLHQARNSLDNGWQTIGAASAPEVPLFDRQAMMATKEAIEQQVGELGRRLDQFLDDLEGRDDTVPERWIDEFEVLEAAYGSWVVQAERKVLENEWKARSDKIEQRPMTAVDHHINAGMLQDDCAIPEIEDPTLDEGAIMRPSMDIHQGGVSTQHAEAGQPALTVSIPPTDQDGQDMSASDSARSGSRVTPNDLIKDEEEKRVAKRRAAFLHDIEINNSLKQSKSPVRPFEHASSAFTKLFKRHQSPEQAMPKRSASGNASEPPSAPSISQTSWRALTPSPTIDSRWNPVSGQGAGDSERGASHVPRGVISISQQRAFPTESVNQRVVSEPTQSSAYDNRPWDAFNLDVRKKPPPETYKPSGLDSPFSSPDKEDFADTDKQRIPEAHSQDIPENWPLQIDSRQIHGDDFTADLQHHRQPESAPLETDSDSEIRKPSKPMQSDAFDQFFLQDMPQFPTEMLESTPAPEMFSTQRPTSRDAAYLDMVSGRSSQRRSMSRPSSSSRLKSASREFEHASIDNLAEMPQALPQAGLAQIEAYVFRSSQKHSSPGPSSTVARPGILVNASSPPASPMSVEDVSFDDEIHMARPNPFKRASMTSIETFSRAEVKSVEVQRPSRQGSTSSKPTPPQTPRLSLDNDPFSKARPMNYKGITALPTPPIQRINSLGQATTPISNVPESVNELSPTAAEGSGPPVSEAVPAPLNIAMTKRRVKKNMQKENERPNSPATNVDARDTFDRHVSEVVENLPSQIRFKPRAGAETPVARGYMAPRTKMPNGRAPSRASNMTIAPAESSPKKSSLTSDPEVKLYHLTQAGREEPIKLFVRLVGEGERVMVRVGGGWADLADYLRQYADHHGSRTVSEGGLEVQALATTHARKVSGPAESRARTPGPGTPNPGTPLRPTSNESDTDFFGRTSTPGADRAYASNGRHTPNSTYMSTPKSTSTGSRPSTANASRPPSRQGNAQDVGLSGPSSGKKGLLPEHKAKWVESMLDRAKKASSSSAEKSNEDNQKYFSELGRAGGTRRVIFRSSPGVGTGEKSKK